MVSEQFYQAIVEESFDAFVVVQAGRLVYANPRAITLFGFANKHEASVYDFLQSLPPQHRHFFDPPTELNGKREVLRNFELQGLTVQGKVIDLEVNATTVAWQGKPAVQASFRDISERKSLEREQALWMIEQETLSEIDKKLISAADLQSVTDTILQQTLKLTHAHWAGVLLVDDSVSEVQWRATGGARVPTSSEWFPMSELLRDILTSQEPHVMHNRNQTVGDLLLPLAKEEGILSSAWMPMSGGQTAQGAVVIAYRNFHEFRARELRLLQSIAKKNSIALMNAELYENLFRRERELERLSGARVVAQEDERRRISREIHDVLGQMLTAIKFNVEILEDSLPVSEDERRRLVDIKQLLDNVMKEAREISYNLMPSVLEDFGLAPALQLYLDQFSTRTGIKATLVSKGMEERLTAPMEIGLYRIVQEAFTNAVKHASCSDISVQLLRDASGLRMMVEDNGSGMALGQRRRSTPSSGGVGLVSMRERAASFGGDLTIDSSPGRGTVLVVEIPLTRT